MKNWQRTKIIATVGPASNNLTELKKIISAGASVLRINAAHGTKAEMAKTIKLIRQASARTAQQAAILFDLPGPKIRLGELSSELIKLKLGQIVEINCDKAKQTDQQIPLPQKSLVRSVKVNEHIFINDGLVKLKVLAKQGFVLKCRVLAAGELRSRKGVNLPQTKLTIPALGKKDRQLLSFALQQGVDFIGLSFVRTENEIKKLRKLIGSAKAKAAIIAKIEKPQALSHLRKIIQAADAVMIARGDLGIEIPFAKVPTVQQQIIESCLEIGRPVITATQMILSMVSAQSPTRAEATDVAHAVWLGCDAVMLSEETSIGAHPAKVVATMKEIASEAENSRVYQHRQLIDSQLGLFRAKVISYAAKELASKLKAMAIVVPTRSGRAPLYVSNQRARPPVLAPTFDARIARQMALYWGVKPVLNRKSKHLNDLLKQAENTARKTLALKKGETIIIASGAYRDDSEIVSLLEVRQI